MTVKNNGTKLNIPMCIACVLLCATLVSIHLTSGLYSRYVAGGSGSDSARVISFGDITLTETGDFLTDGDGNATTTLRIAPGVDLEKQANVSFTGSESAVYVFVSVSLGSGWSASDTGEKTFVLKSDENELVSWSVADGWSYVADTTAPYVYYIELAPNAKLENAAFFRTIDDDGNTIKVSESMTAAQLSSLTIQDITLQAAAVQSNGFSSVTDAWDAVKDK